MKNSYFLFLCFSFLLTLFSCGSIKKQTFLKEAQSHDKKLTSNALLGYNPDNEIIIGFQNSWEKGKIRHHIEGDYFSATSGVSIGYQLNLKLPKNNFALGFYTNYTSPNYAMNFFGYGNNSADPFANNQRSLDYNRVKIERFILGSTLYNFHFLGGQFGINLNYKSYKIENTPDSFVATQFKSDDEIFKKQNFINAELNYASTLKQISSIPNLKVAMNSSVGFTKNIANNGFEYLISGLSLQYPILANKTILFSSKAKGHFIFGNDFEFFQAARIGGNEGLRAFRNERFIGNAAWYHSSDIHFLLKEIKTSYSPINFGVYSGFDYGKVYSNHFLINPSFTNRLVNIAYGGGLFVNAIEKINGNIAVFHGFDGYRVTLAFNFNF